MLDLSLFLGEFHPTGQAIGNGEVGTGSGGPPTFTRETGNLFWEEWDLNRIQYHRLNPP